MKRNAYFDNAKLLLIFLVVFGHMIQPFTENSAGISTLYTWIYTFHMPAFIFLAGFFAKGSGNLKYIGNLAKKLLIPYLIFQALYTGYYFMIGKNDWLTDHVFYPHWSLWFLVSLFCWHILLIFYRHIPAYVGIPLALTIGIFIGYFDNVEHMFSLSRTFVFFPFFLIGYHCSQKHIAMLKNKYVKLTSLLVLITIFIAIYFLPEINSGWLLASKSYTTLGLDYLGGLARLLVYSTSSLMVVSILAWIPNQRFSITYLGERTLYVYLLHGFIIQYIRQADLFSLNHMFDLIGLAILSAIIVFVLSSRIVITIAQPLIEISTSQIQRVLQQFRQLRDV